MRLPLVNRPSNEVRFSHHPVLDGVRGIAVLMVLVTHFGGLSTANYHYFHPGLLGVDIFFVLSGFLITSILLREFETSLVQVPSRSEVGTASAQSGDSCSLLSHVSS